MNGTKKIFKYQLWHLVSLIVLLLIINLCLGNSSEMLSGSFWRVGTKTWLWVAITVPILHQIYVWLIWRLELYQRIFTKRYGLKQAFNMYEIGFTILFAGRMITIITLAISNKNTLHINPRFAYALAALITPLVIYLFYSVKKYFTIERAYGIDHFDKHYREPFEKKGIFKYTNNGMYVVGLMILYLPGLLLLSKAAILVALFNHVYIWVHYYFTERPDMLEIYGDAP
jgi:hypothetical protein